MPLYISSNQAHYTFTSNNKNFSVYAFNGYEEIQKPYEFEIELVSRSANEDVPSLLGTPACLTIIETGAELNALINTATDDATRYVHGLIHKIEQLHTSHSYTHYRAVLVPRLWYLDKISDNRIFQNLSVVEIIHKILQEQCFNADDFSFQLCHKYESREYCVQYGETDLYFISRLCEEEGIFFYFEHTKEHHCLCFSDYEGGPKISGDPDLRFYPGSGNTADKAVINKLQINYTVTNNAVTYADWNFTQPLLDLKLTRDEPRPGFVCAPQGMWLEQYKYPHIYQSRKQGNHYAEIHLQRQLCRQSLINLQSNAVRFLPGFTFGIHGHPRNTVNSGWWVISVRQEGKQPGVLEHEAPNERGAEYSATVTALPELVRFIPTLDHPKKLIEGLQSAIVTGPKGEEIFTDEYGRVKVQFFWDRQGQWNDATSCWIRVSQGWAGGQFGALTTPRIGHEVLVSFLEGDPDRPIITGRAYDALNMPPYTLPEHKTISVFKSLSTPRLDGEPRGFNELRIQDERGNEELYIHAEKDVNTYTKNDWKDVIAHDRHSTVKNNTYTKTEGETHETLVGPRKTELKASDNLTVCGDGHARYMGKLLVKSKDELHFESGNKTIIEAETELTLKAGGAWLKLTASGIKASGSTIYLTKGGTPANGSGANPLLPDNSLEVDEGQAPKCQIMTLRSSIGAPTCKICEDQCV